MGQEVVLVGRAELDAIYQSLKKVMDHSKEALGDVGQLGTRTNDALEKSTKNTERSIKQTGGALRRLSSQLYSDFKGLLSLQALQGGLKLSNQFAGSISESLKLTDSVRRLGPAFGVAAKDFGFFQAKLARGLGDIGVGSEAAANALQGMAGYGVSGIESATNLAKGAAELAQIGGEKGNEKAVAGGLASALQSQGKDVNDLGAQRRLIGEVTAAVTATGKGASEILKAMDDVFSGMPIELRRTLGPEAMAQLATVASTAGPGATKAFQEFMSKSTAERSGMEAQGFGSVFKNGKIDMAVLGTLIKSFEARGLSAREGVESAGFSPEAAEGLVRLNEKAALVKENLDKLAKASRDSDAAFRSTLGPIDAFKGNINTIKGYIEETFMGVGQKAADVMSSTIGSPAGSGAVVGAGALAAAVLAGGGLRGLLKFGSGALAGEAKEKAYEAVTGENVTPVRITNWSDAPAGMPGGGMPLPVPAAGAGANLLGVGAIAAVAAYGLTEVKSKNDNGELVSVLDRLTDFISGDSTYQVQKAQNPKVHITVEKKDPDIRVGTQPGRGAYF